MESLCELVRNGTAIRLLLLREMRVDCACFCMGLLAHFWPIRAIQGIHLSEHICAQESSSQWRRTGGERSVYFGIVYFPKSSALSLCVRAYLQPLSTGHAKHMLSRRLALHGEEQRGVGLRSEPHWGTHWRGASDWVYRGGKVVSHWQDVSGAALRGFPSANKNQPIFCPITFGSQGLFSHHHPPPVCRSASLPVCRSASLPVCRSASLSVCLSFYLSTCLTINVPS